MNQRLLLYSACLMAIVWSVQPVCVAASLKSPTVAAFARQDPPTAQFATAAAVASEEGGRARASVTLSAPPSQEVAVTVSVMGGTATVGEDVSPTAQSSTLTFRADGPQTQDVVLPVQADQEVEGIEYLDLQLQSDAVAVGDAGAFRLWIRDAVLYPDLQARALTRQLQADFSPATMLEAEQAADTIMGSVWNAGGAIRGVFSDAQAVITPTDHPRAAAQDQGLAVDHVWPAPLADIARRDLHLLLPVGTEVEATRRSAKGFVRIEDGASGEAAPYLRPRDGLKGDVARALLYFHALYPDQSEAGTLERLRPLLVQWMQDDPVDDDELRRNTIIARYQGTPNPFVIAPELAEPTFNLRRTYPTPTISFAGTRGSVSEADSMAVIEVAVDGMGDSPVTFDLFLDEEDGTVDEADLPNFRRQTITFPAHTPDGTVRRIQVPIAPDEVEEDTEQASFGIDNLSGFAHVGETVRYQLAIENAVPPSQAQSGRVTLGPPYPNPLSPGRGSTVRFELTMEEAEPFSVEVFSTLGQRVWAHSYSAGEAERLSAVEIDGEDLPSGLYIVRLRGPSFSTTETFVVVR